MLNRCREGLHRQISLWLMVWSLFALIGCPFWCDNTPDSPFAVPAFRAPSPAAASPLEGQDAATRTTTASVAGVHQGAAALPHSVFSSFDFDEFCQCACQQIVHPASPFHWALPSIALTTISHPIALQGALDERGPPDPDIGTLRSTSRRSSLLGRAPPLSV